jgi:hypothetical protein
LEETRESVTLGGTLLFLFIPSAQGQWTTLPTHNGFSLLCSRAKVVEDKKLRLARMALVALIISSATQLADTSRTVFGLVSEERGT